MSVVRLVLFPGLYLLGVFALSQPAITKSVNGLLKSIPLVGLKEMLPISTRTMILLFSMIFLIGIIVIENTEGFTEGFTEEQTTELAAFIKDTPVTDNNTLHNYFEELSNRLVADEAQESKDAGTLLKEFNSFLRQKPNETQSIVELFTVPETAGVPSVVAVSVAEKFVEENNKQEEQGILLKDFLVGVIQLRTAVEAMEEEAT